MSFNRFLPQKANSHQEGARERGAVMIETALVALVLFTFLFGIIESASLFTIKSDLSSASRGGARIGSGLGDARWTDWAIIESIRAELDVTGADVQKVIIFHSTQTGDIPPTCDTQSVVGVCNHYDANQFETLTVASFGAQQDTTCGVSPDNAWCPTSRAKGTDLVGVYVETQYQSATGLFDSSFSRVSDTTVLRLEPAQ